MFLATIADGKTAASDNCKQHWDKGRELQELNLSPRVEFQFWGCPWMLHQLLCTVEHRGNTTILFEITKFQIQKPLIYETAIAKKRLKITEGNYFL